MQHSSTQTLTTQALLLPMEVKMCVRGACLCERQAVPRHSKTAAVTCQGRA
ncbi:hypothetical protein ZEAMMB73_Zm00001d013501 [Zea mays]|uniref:Uncharacterized protein n=1 Tax=Zea mays TaxID=4577 RepID=D1ME33_MAIZE|nr:unknown [Zea mays]AQK63723.1 hypothetical protein ZEAMMB73_Zm00001d013501 [Zea mays]